MLTLPAVDPPTWRRFQVRLGRDHYVRVGTCDYSVDPAAIGHQVTVLSDNEKVIVLATGGEIVAEHTRCWARHQTITDPEHAESGRIMRQGRTWPPDWPSGPAKPAASRSPPQPSGSTAWPRPTTPAAWPTSSPDSAAIR